MQQALEEDMLCPFHYYGVGEYIKEAPDGKFMGQQVSADSMTDKDRSEFSRWLEQLTDPNRSALYHRQNPDLQRSRNRCARFGVLFSRDEAKRLSAMFNEQVNQQAERPYRTKAITGENSQAERDEAVKQLENGELDYIFTVDLFNEGVDIPHINQIVMLRQTQSSIISHSSSAEVYVRQAVKIRL